MTSEPAWVVDASVALKWYLLDEEFVEDATALRDSYVNEDLAIFAPNYIRYEILNALEVARLQQRITASEASAGFRHFVDLGFYLPEDGDDLLASAAEISRAYEISPYDALYLALAENSDELFVTADRRLYRRIRDHVPYARWIGEVNALL